MGGLKIVFGTAGFNPTAAWKDTESQGALLDALVKVGVKNLDTAQLYGDVCTPVNSASQRALC